MQDAKVNLEINSEALYVLLCLMSLWLITSECKHPRVHAAFVRGRSTCQLQQSVRVGSVVCVFVGAIAGGRGCLLL